MEAEAARAKESTRTTGPPHTGRWLVALFVVWALVYAQTVGHDFVWDDWLTIVDNPQYEEPLVESLRATQHDHLDGTLMGTVALPVAYESYRPLLFASFKLDDWLSGRAAWAMHLHNLIVGAACIALAFALSTALFSNRRHAWLVTAIFALHPVGVESFSYVSARSDLLTTLFGFAAAACALASAHTATLRGRAAWSLSAAAAFFLSLAAKEASVALPLAVAILALALGRLRAVLLALAALVTSGAAYFAMRVSLIGERLSTVDGGSGAEALWHLPAHALHALRILVAPYDLSIERMAGPDALTSAIAWVGWLGVALLGGAALRGRLGAWNAPTRIAVAGLAWLFLWLAPSSLAVETMGVLADRYLLATTFGFAVAVVAIGAELARRVAPRALFAPAAWAAALVAISAVQVSVWRDNERLYGHSLLVEPASSMSHYRVGVLRARQSRWPEALELFEMAAALDDENLSALNNLGVAYLNVGRLDDADRSIRRALALSGDLNFRAWNNLASVYFARDLSGEGCSALRRSLSINAAYAFARRNHALYCEEHAQR